ncbi:MAG: carbamoyl phosphate synthase small subunit [Syntrophomonadaceae bacterium]|nr:carbamoyl phosphate synthase small subunit [Syntrophomonadaceae bacterium]
MKTNPGYLVLENGTVFSGQLLGSGSHLGEVVFNTSMVGYEQIISDPSYAGQIVVLTYPLVGNYGFNPQNMEAQRSWLKGLVVNQLCNGSDHYEQQMSLGEYLYDHSIPCLQGVDTRALTRMLRLTGTMGGIITTRLDNLADLQKQAGCLTPPPGGYVGQVTRTDMKMTGLGPRRVVLIDYGVKRSIITSLVARRCQVIVVPAQTSARTILDLEPDGIVLSNGPGDPADCGFAIATIRRLVLGGVPIFGICLGHQLLSLALGGKTSKMKFGHRGANQPVKDLRSGRVYMTSQNHGYTVEESSFHDKAVQVVFSNLNDNTVEGLIHQELPLMSVQFHPEAAPGPLDTGFLMDEFVARVDAYIGARELSIRRVI